jgi:hypothetical protein
MVALTKFVRLTSVGGAVLAVCVATATPSVGGAQDSDKLLAEVRAAWEKREKAAQNLSAKWRQEELMPKGGITRLAPFFAKGEVMPAQDTKLTGHGHLYFAGANCRVSLDWPVWSMTNKQFDRTVRDAALKSSVLKSRTAINGQATKTGTISKEEWNTWGGGNVWPLMTIYRGTTTQGMEANLSIYTSARRVRLDTGPGIELVRERTETRGRARLLVDPARDYLPTLCEDFDLADKLQSRFVIRSRKDDRFGWVPESWDVSSFRGSQLSRSVACRLDELVIGGSIPEDLFDLTYEHGTYVHDSTGDKPRDLIIREGKEPREVLPQERGAPFERLIETEVGDLLPGGRPSVVRKYWWAFAGGAGALVLVALLVWRGRRPRGVQS